MVGGGRRFRVRQTPCNSLVTQQFRFAELVAVAVWLLCPNRAARRGLAVPIRSGAHPERLEEYQALTEATTKVKTPHLRGFHGASGTRTRALLGAIQERSIGKPAPQAGFRPVDRCRTPRIPRAYPRVLGMGSASSPKRLGLGSSQKPQRVGRDLQRAA